MATTGAKRDFVIVETHSLAVDVGQSMLIKVPVDTNGSASGSFALSDIDDTTGQATQLSKTVAFRGRDIALANGFAVDNPGVGTLVAKNNEPCLAVEYTHKVGEGNIIWFFSNDGRVAQINIIKVIIHDHTSIYQGGPAHGTYFSKADDQQPS